MYLYAQSIHALFNVKTKCSFAHNVYDVLCLVGNSHGFLFSFFFFLYHYFVFLHLITIRQIVFIFLPTLGTVTTPYVFYN